MDRCLYLLLWEQETGDRKDGIESPRTGSFSSPLRAFLHFFAWDSCLPAFYVPACLCLPLPLCLCVCLQCLPATTCLSLSLGLCVLKQTRPGLANTYKSQTGRHLHAGKHACYTTRHDSHCLSTFYTLPFPCLCLGSPHASTIPTIDTHGILPHVVMIRLYFVC